MPLPPSRMNREEGEAGEIYDAPPPPPRPAAQRHPSAAGSYASLALDPPSHLQRMSSNASDDSRRGRAFIPRGGRGREGFPGRFGGRGQEEHRPSPMHSQHGMSGGFSTGLPSQRGAPLLARGRGGFSPGGRFPARGQSTGRWVAGRERVPEQDAVHEPASTFSSGFPVPRGGRGSFIPRGGPVDGRGRGFNPRGGGFEGRGRPIPFRGRGMDGRGFPFAARGSMEGRGPPPQISHRPDFENKRTYSDLVNEPPQSTSFPGHQKRIRGNPSFGSEGEIIPQNQEAPHHPSAYHAQSHSMPPGPPVTNTDSFSTRGPPQHDGGAPRPRTNFPPAPPMHTSNQPLFRQPDWGGSVPPDRTHIEDRHSMDRPGFIRGPNNAGPQGNAEPSFENRALHHPYDRSDDLNSSMGRSDGVPKGPPPPPPDSNHDHPGPPPRNTSWGAVNSNRGGPPSGIGQGGPPHEAQRQFPPPSFGHRPETGGFVRGGPGRGFFPGRGDGRGRAMRAREILAGRGGDILGGRGPPAPPPFSSSTYDEYSNRPPLEYGGGGRGRGRGGGRMTMMQSPQPPLGWPTRSIPPQREESSKDVKMVPPPLPTPVLPAEPTEPQAPEPAEPSGYVTALIRLADLEAQMEYEFAKHMQLLNRHKELKAQYKILENLPVGLDAIKDDLAKLENKASA